LPLAGALKKQFASGGLCALFLHFDHQGVERQEKTPTSVNRLILSGGAHLANCGHAFFL
jgi:hypothetical protein